MDMSVIQPPAMEIHDVLLCSNCEKPFTKETSWKRHVSYCKRTQHRPRIRREACQPCSAAKTKCTLETQCQRCKRKNIPCVYNRRPSVSHNRLRRSARSVAPVSLGSYQHGSLSTEGTPLDQTPLDLSTIQDNVLGSANAGMLDAFQPPFPHQDFTPDEMTNFALPEVGSTALALNIPAVVTANGLPWNPPSSNYTYPFPNVGNDSSHNRFEYFPLGPGLRDWESSPEIPYLKPLLQTDRLARHYGLMVIRALRGYPQMMLRQDTFPPFIHSKIYSASNDDSVISLPAPLANCMRIAEMFALRTDETRPFLWHAISEELKTHLCNAPVLSKYELLSAVQASVIYIIMRAIDSSSPTSDNVMEMLLVSQTLVEHMKRAMNDDICCHMEQQVPSSDWAEWVFNESRRRLTSLWCVLTRVFSLKTFFAHDDRNSFLAAPLPSAKSVWEAKRAAQWAMEYNSTDMGSISGFRIFGDLAKANRGIEDPIYEEKFDTWNSSIDNFGMLLNMASPVVVSV